MSEKMRNQQEEAQKRASQQQSDATAKPKAQEQPLQRRQSRRTPAKDSIAEDTNTDKDTSSQKKRGRPKKGAGKAMSITNFFKKADVEVGQNNPTVQEALVQAADEYEANPTALGEQDLVAMQQPKLVSGGIMRKYQLEGLEWLKTLWMNGLCGILADEMGLGKTVQAISMIAHMKESNSNGPFLIAGPLSTVGNWIEEFKRWTPGINAVKYHGNKDERANIRRLHMNVKNQKKADFPVVCTSYEICMNDRKFLGQYDWQYIIVVSFRWARGDFTPEIDANQSSGRGPSPQEYELPINQRTTYLPLC